MKPVCFLGDSLNRLREFPTSAKHDAGFQLDRLQHGLQPEDFKPMPSVGRGVEEIRIREEGGTYRVLYTARMADAIYVLHAFQKKTQATSRHDLQLARIRFTALLREQR
jgi:phage-related protein